MVPLASRKEPPLLAASQTVLFSWSEMTGLIVGSKGSTVTVIVSEVQPNVVSATTL